VQSGPVVPLFYLLRILIAIPRLHPMQRGKNQSRGWNSISIRPQFLLFRTSTWRHNFVVSGSVWMKFGRQMLNYVKKQEILL